MSEDWDIVIETVTKSLLVEHYLKWFKRKKYRLVSWFHFTIKGNRGFAKYARYADEFWAISSGIEEELLRLGVSSNQIHLIYNPVDYANIIPLSKQPIKKLVYVGRLFDESKNISGLIRALSQCNSEKYILYIYGDGEDCIMLKELAAQFQIPVQWMGWSQHPWDEVVKNGIDYLVFSSVYEGFPMVLLEAIARGVPVLSSNCPDGPEDMVKNGVNGYLYQYDDMNQLIQLLQYALDKDMDDWNQKAIQQSIPFYVDRYLNHLDSIIESKEE